MTGKRMSGNSLRPLTCRPERFNAALMRTAKLSKKSARWVKKRFYLEIKKERFRTCEAAEAMGANSLTVWDNVLTVRGGHGRRASWPASFLLKRPPRRTEMGVQEIAQQWTSLRRSGGVKSAAWSTWRSLVAILTKAKNTKYCKYHCFLLRLRNSQHRSKPRLWIHNTNKPF
jgi:hypothetical protein